LVFEFIQQYIWHLISIFLPSCGKPFLHHRFLNKKSLNTLG
jgi:hypothetical protein